MRGLKAGVRNGLLVAMAVILASCGGGNDESDIPPPPETEEGAIVERSRADQVAAERRERDRQRLAAEATQDFVYARYAPDLSGEQPKACLVFSKPLDPEIEYSIYVDFEGDQAPAYSVEGEQLCLNGLSFNSTSTATLLEGLPAASGEALARQEDVQISFEDRPPYVGFSGSGIILPREDADGLAIETVNVDQIEISVSRVNDRVLAFKSLTRGEEAAQGRYAYVYGDENPSDVSTEIWSGSMSIDNMRNAPVTTVFPLPDVIETLEPGAYYVEISDAKELGRYDGPAASAKRWIMLTDLALTAYRSQSGLDVTLRSLQDGRAIANTNVKLIARNNEVLGEGATAVDGRVSFNPELLAGSGNLAPKIILASGLKGDTAVLDLTRAPVDLSELETGGRQTPGLVDAYLYTERGIYRPGETVYLTAMMRDRAARAIEERAGTLITYRPNGMEASRERFLSGPGGTIQRNIDLPRDAARGLWRTVLEMDGSGQAGSISYSVEDFVPQRIAVELATEEAPYLPGDDGRLIEIDSRFLYGAPGAGLSVRSQARIEPDPSPFEAWDGFKWGAHTSTFRQEIIDLEDRTTDGEGKASVLLRPGSRGASADIPLRLNTVVSVLEPGGRAVTESVRIPYRSRDLYLGTKPGFEGRLPRGGNGLFDIASVDAEGNGVDKSLSWKVLEIDYHYDWYREDGRWRWRRSRTVRTVNEGGVNTQNGAGQVGVSGLGWGPHELIIESDDGQKTSRSFYVGWGGNVSDDGVEAPDRVQVSVTEQEIVSGRPAAITIVPPYDGEAQIVVATDRVLSVETRQVSAEGTELTLPVSDEWGEGAYVLVNVYTERDPVLQSKPRRAVGAAYLPVEMGTRTFNVSIDAPELVRPNRSETITINLDGGPREKAFVTLAAVDEGVLRLTKFSSPDPADWYYGKKALGVSLYDDYGRLLDPNLGLPAEVRSGGDQLGGEGLSVVPTKSIALFSGIVEVGRGGKAQIEFETPDFNGELRLMAVAWSDTGLGAADQSMTVREQAPSDMILPRFMAPGDEAVATVSIDNVELAAGTFNASVYSDGVIDVPAEGVTATIPQSQRVDQPVRFEAEGAGLSNMRLDVSGPGGFSVSRDYQIETRSPYLPITRISKTLMEAEESYEPDMSLLDGFVPGTEAITVSYSGLPVDSNSLYHSLARYPYGCTEQTTSRALPLVYVEQLVDEGADGSRGSAKVQVQEAVTRILNRQSANGAFGLWREGDGYASPWLGAYTTDFVYRAKQAGFQVPQAALDRAYESMREIAAGNAWRVYGYDTNVWESRWHNDTEDRLMKRAAPYALYVLAREGKADISRLRYLHDRELGEMRSPLARAHLGAALAMMGDRARAKSAFDSAEDALGYDNNGDYYQTPLRDLAGVISLAAEAEFNDHVTRLASQLGEDVPEPSELSTQEKAFLLVAVSSLSQDDGLRLDVDGLGGGNDNDRRYFLTADQIDDGVSFRLKRGSSPVFQTVMVTGAPDKAPPIAAESLSVSKSVRTISGGRVDLSRITQGDQFVVVLTISPKERRNNPVIVADLLPAGFEIETVLRNADGARENGASGAFSWIGNIDTAQTAEARDDRYVAAIDVVTQDRTLAYVVRAVTPGEFAMPGVVAEDMYRPDVFARSAATRVTIAPQVAATGGSR